MGLPVPTKLPEVQLPEYHRHEAPLPRVPPETVKVLGLPDATDGGLAEADDGTVDDVFTVTILLAVAVQPFVVTVTV